MGIKKTDLTVLVVDDDKDARFLLRRILESRGYRVILAEGVADCKKQLEEDPPHLVILDVELQDGSAFDILSYIGSVEKFKSINIILLSNHSETAIITKAISMGVKDYLVKPINSKIITERVEKILEHLLETRGETLVFSMDTEKAKAKISYKTNITKISENSFNISSNVYLRSRTNINVVSSILKNIDIELIPQRVISTSTMSEKLQKIFSDKKYEINIAFVAVSEKISRKIRKFINVRLTGSNK